MNLARMDQDKIGSINSLCVNVSHRGRLGTEERGGLRIYCNGNYKIIDTSIGSISDEVGLNNINENSGKDIQIEKLSQKVEELSKENLALKTASGDSYLPGSFLPREHQPYALGCKE